MAQNLLFVSMHIFVWLQISLGSIFFKEMLGATLILQNI